MAPAAMILMLVARVASAAPTAEQKCEAGQNVAAGKVAACLAKAQKKFAVDADGVALSLAAGACTTALSNTWQALEQAATDAGASCPGTPNEFATQLFLRACHDELASALHGGTLRLDVTTCNSALATCSMQLAACGASRAKLPATGQTTSYGAGSDGTVRAGSELSYTDNLNGTITDNVTGLLWEKKDDTGGIHGRHRTFLRRDPAFSTDTIATEFLATLNDGAGFAGYTDWRLPTIKELISIVDYEVAASGPTVDRAFHATTCAGCSDLTQASCSCTGESFAYSYCSSTYSGANLIWTVRFEKGDMVELQVTTPCLVRAVRGGL